jgi:hypothetical protein
MMNLFPLYGADNARQDYLQNSMELQIMVLNAHPTTERREESLFLRHRDS